MGMELFVKFLGFTSQMDYFLASFLKSTADTCFL